MSHRRINPAILHSASGFSTVTEPRVPRDGRFAGRASRHSRYRTVGDDIHFRTIAAMTNVKTAMNVPHAGGGRPAAMTGAA